MCSTFKDMLLRARKPLCHSQSYLRLPPPIVSSKYKEAFNYLNRCAAQDVYTRHYEVRFLTRCKATSNYCCLPRLPPKHGYAVSYHDKTASPAKRTSCGSTSASAPHRKPTHVVPQSLAFCSTNRLQQDLRNTILPVGRQEQCSCSSRPARSCEGPEARLGRLCS